MTTTINKSALMAHPVSTIFALVADIESYPEFLPGCVGAEVLETTSDGVVARLDLAKAGVKQSFVTSNTNIANESIHLQLADMMLKVESARSLVYYAACIIDAWYEGSTDRNTLLEASLMASACAGDAAFFNAGSGIQMHGGVGITEEYDIQLYFKRARSTESYLGRPSEMREQLATMLLDGVDS